MKVNMGQPNDLLLDDLELLLREIDEFNTAVSNNKPLDIPQSLENYLQFVAKSGNTVFPWPHVRNLIRTKMVNAIQQFQEPACPNENFVLERFDLFRLAAPFTVQRLTELILQPTRHYRKKEKFLRGLEKTVLVVSTIEPHSLTHDEERNGNDTSASSCEPETETVSFNRTITLDPQDILSTSITTSSIDVINQDPAESIAISSVTTSAVSATVGGINQNRSITSGVLLSETITSSAVPSIESVSVTSDDIVLESSEAAGVDSMESGESEDTLTSSGDASSIENMDHNVSENMIIDPVTSAVGAAVDVISQDICVTSDVTIPESVATTAVIAGVDIVPTDKTIAVVSDVVMMDAVYDETGVTCIQSEEGQNIVIASEQTSSIDVINATASESIILDPVTSSAVSTAIAVDVIHHNVSSTPNDILSESITSSAISSMDVIASERVIAVTSAEVITQDVVTPAATLDDVEEPVSSEGQATSSVEVMDESEESVTIDPITSAVSSIVGDIVPDTSVTSDTVLTESVTTSIESAPAVLSDKGAANCDSVISDTACSTASAVDAIVESKDDTSSDTEHSSL